MRVPSLLCCTTCLHPHPRLPFMGVATAVPTWIDWDFFGNYHSLEMPFVFDNEWPPLLHNFGSRQKEMAKSFGAFWTNLARFADVNGGESPLHWFVPRAIPHCAMLRRIVSCICGALAHRDCTATARSCAHPPACIFLPGSRRGGLGSTDPLGVGGGVMHACLRMGDQRWGGCLPAYMCTGPLHASHMQAAVDVSRPGVHVPGRAATNWAGARSCDV